MAPNRAHPSAAGGRPRTLSFAQAAREYGLQPEDVRALVAAGLAWTVTPPGRARPRVVREGLEAG